MPSFDSINPRIRTIYTTSVHTVDKEIVHKKLSLTYRLLISLKSTFILRYDDKEVLCGSNDLIYMPPRQRYETVFFTGESAFMNIFFDFFPDVSRSGEQEEPITNFFVMTDRESADPTKFSERVEFVDMPEFNRLNVVCNMPDVESKCSELYRLYCDNSRFTRLRLNARLTEFIVDTAEYIGLSKQNPSRLAAKSIVSYIDEHYRDRLTCRSVAQVFSYHPNYVNRIVRELTGLSLHEYIVAVKIRHANRLLLETDMTITDIAYYLAFHDSSSFSSVYRAHTGMKPSERRKLGAVEMY